MFKFVMIQNYTILHQLFCKDPVFRIIPYIRILKELQFPRLFIVLIIRMYYLIIVLAYTRVFSALRADYLLYLLQLRHIILN